MANAGALGTVRGMDTSHSRLPAPATADPRLTPEAIAHRRAAGLVERDEHGRLLPGSQLPGKGRKGGPMVTTLARLVDDNYLVR
jgi:hypothetical protein